MAHYAFIDENNIVTEVIVGKDENDFTDGVGSWEEWYGNFRGQKCLRTSYNTRGGVHVRGGTPFRYNYAEIGGEYRQDKDGFVPPKPRDNPSFVLDEATLTWKAPVSYPEEEGDYVWLEQEQRWIPRDEHIIYMITSSDQNGG